MSLSSTKPEKEGWQAFVDGKNEDECPFAVDTEDWTDWMIGWHEARLAPGMEHWRNVP